MKRASLMAMPLTLLRSLGAGNSHALFTLNPARQRRSLVRMKTKSSALFGLVGIGVLASNNLVASQESARSETKVVKDLVKGSIHHRPAGGKQVEWERIVGKVQIINPSTLQFADGPELIWAKPLS